jgi:hypothetical protein
MILARLFDLKFLKEFAANGQELQIGRTRTSPAMQRRSTILLAFAIGLICATPSILYAGGSFDDDEFKDDKSLTFYGFVRDTRGLGVGDAKVTAEVKDQASVTTRTDVLGVYKIRGISLDVKPQDVTISCSKDGYKVLRVLRRTEPGPDVKGFETECTLERM